jgi:hypothetical protein
LVGVLGLRKLEEELVQESEAVRALEWEVG